jgi:nucleoside-diphosphate-sugar epimerase
MRVLLTGSNGFVGSHLLRELLAQGLECATLVRSLGPCDGVTSYRVDCRDGEAVQRAMADFRPTVVYHCAMTSGHPQSPGLRSEALATSVIGTSHLLEAALACGVSRFVHAGSFLVYEPKDRPLREEDPIAPSSLRGAAKAGASLWLQQFAKLTGLSAVELRIFSVYGPGEAAHRFIPTVLRAARDGGTLPLLRGPSHDFVYVQDVVDALQLAAATNLAPGAVFNISGGVAWKNEEVVEVARRVTGRPIVIADGAYPMGPADVGRWVGDITAAQRQLGWQPRFDLEAGLEAAYRSLCLT